MEGLLGGVTFSLRPIVLAVRLQVDGTSVLLHAEQKCVVHVGESCGRFVPAVPGIVWKTVKADLWGRCAAPRSTSNSQLS